MKIILLILLLMPLSMAYSFTEIMYDPVGSDYGYEWVEVYGDSLEGGYFIESGGRHGLTLVAGSCLVNCVSIIAQNSDNFLSLYTVDSSVLVYDSSWGSLKNTGEMIGLEIDGDVVYLTYEPLAKSPLSLQYTRGWFGDIPSPGVYMSVEVPEWSALGLVSIFLVLGIFVIRKREKLI